MVLTFASLLLVVVAARTAGFSSAVSIALEGEQGQSSRPTLPSFLHGKPEDQQVHEYAPGIKVAPHTADGKGLHHATVGVPTSFTIRLADEKSAPPHDQWNTGSTLFMYVWIANADQILIAEVANNNDGTLTATYESSFPGQYYVHVEAIRLKNVDEGQPIVGSPFGLTIEGEPSLNLEELPLCGTEEGEEIASTFWRPGTWVSSNIASASHGVMRDGWVFQPKTCVYDAFSYKDLMLLAEQNKPTWILVLGGSVQRGVFLSLVDMGLAKGQKDELGNSALAKCWGYADIQIGNLRLSYQDFRLYTVAEAGDSTICNDNRLQSSSTAMYVHSCQQFLETAVFQEGGHWPDVILGLSNLVDGKDAPNMPIEVMMEALPPDWSGKLVMVDHMAGFGNHWTQSNPTSTSLEGVDLVYHDIPNTSDHGLGKMARYEDEDPRTSFMSIFPMYQAKLFENESTRPGKRRYGGSVHYHYMSSASSVEAYNGAKMVHSTITEMIANILIGKAVGTKAALYAASVRDRNDTDGRSSAGDTFQVCTECPPGLLPYVIEENPQPACAKTSALPGNAPKGKVWHGALCPKWCFATKPIRQKATGSGKVGLRSCPMEAASP